MKYGDDGCIPKYLPGEELPEGTFQAVGLLCPLPQPSGWDGSVCKAVSAELWMKKIPIQSIKVLGTAKERVWRGRRVGWGFIFKCGQCVRAILIAWQAFTQCSRDFFQLALSSVILSETEADVQGELLTVPLAQLSANSSCKVSCTHSRLTSV